MKRSGGPVEARRPRRIPAGDFAACALAGGVHRTLPAGTKAVLSGMAIRFRLAPNVSEARRQGLTALFGHQFRRYRRTLALGRNSSTLSTEVRKPRARPTFRHPNVV